LGDTLEYASRALWCTLEIAWLRCLSLARIDQLRIVEACTQNVLLRNRWTIVTLTTCTEGLRLTCTDAGSAVAAVTSVRALLTCRDFIFCATPAMQSARSIGKLGILFHIYFFAISVDELTLTSV
jgi:hypothetical protein